MKRWMALVALLATLVSTAEAWRPAGWAYHDYPWAYDGETGDWYWFNTPDTQWVVRMSNGQWAKLQNSALATGWGFYQWPYAYAQGSGGWHWINEPDVQWAVNMGTGEWSRFGDLAVPSDLALIPAGTNAGTDPDFGAYSLTSGSYYMGKREVTKALWDEVYDWATGRGYVFDNAGSGKGTNHPVHTVNWFDCVKWCNARSEKEGRPAVYTVDGATYKTGQSTNVVQTSAAGYRLPTAEEWEYAARGGVASRRFPWGDSDEIQHARANYFSSADLAYDTSPTRGYHPTSDVGSVPYTSPAGSFAANGYGLDDMSGNAAEWCYDTSSPLFITKGGSYADESDRCRVGHPSVRSPGTAFNTCGFRVVLTPAR